MKLIGLIGSAGSGKNAFAEEFHFHKFYEYAFADPLKKACAEMFSISEKAFYDSKLKEISDPYWKVSPREILQFVGTELVRSYMSRLLPEVDTNFWVESMKYKIYQHQVEEQATGEETRLIITDCRFVNEVELILQLGGHICYLTRPEVDGTAGIQGHLSEQLAKEFPDIYPESPEERIHYIQNDGTLDELKIKAHAFASSITSL